MAEIFVSIGSNVDPDRNVRSALRSLRRHFAGVRRSAVYESRAVGFSGANFLNLVVAATTSLTPLQTTAALREIEAEHGRDRSLPRFGPRTLDLDLLLYDDLVCESPLHLPRPEISQHAFVLAPLADLVPERRHPLLGQTFGELWRRFDATDQPLRRIDFDEDATD